MFSKILIANRGEIAVRIIRTARRMGIATVAVFSEADANALHVREADEAHAIGPAPAAQSYLRGDVILDVARRSGAEAVHPGYGFLSENAEFAEACAASGIAFIGPPAAAIRAMGSKAESKRLMVAAGVPTVPGYHGEAQEEALLAAEAARIGFPVLIKASAGGGGKGMRPVYAAQDFAAELAGARREAQAAFGDARVLIEKYLQRPRHVEVQVFGDSHGRVTHLHTRDCSVQRRHQKVLEEAPAPDLSDVLRTSLHEAAENAARAVGYTNAGTVEFVVEGEHAYFLEMNTRLQVEHPVTEMITGLDLVEWQLRVAAGEALPTHWPPPAQGHAVEVRVYAEEPEQDFRPATGRLRKFTLADAGARFDTGFTPGDTVTAAYDPMLAKVIVAGTDRGAALTRLASALDALEIEGLGNNARFLTRLARHPALRAGELDTGFIARHAEALLTPRGPAPERVLMAAAAALAEAGRRAPAASPWLGRQGWRLQGAAETVEAWDDGTGPRQVTLRWLPGGHAVAVGEGAARILSIRGTGTRLALVEGDAAEAFTLTPEADGCTLRMGGESWRLHRRDPHAPASEDAAGESRLSAPIPGRVVKLLAAVGDAVVKGQLLAVLEAMKTEIKITAPRDGVVAHLGCAEGENVEEGVEILSLAT
ncbi:acetyl/propionyl/methylcrotonyl-CoA carboxylase subunit alpha [Sediminicoccus rosea]|uniref:Biotin carboxylase N-terminal domain-containing protein n=1 Tax=Sediminicoccus rosea TaxID=1225128 RepID=A0ABZ0PBW0_9PROT|nr:biotin carboxylase N-terminal domain-containing protein [Sediminicoccus rosea]WPB82972.1 biotin carboxylase N-terminal domain-containing protein [Sediminicoccus rosea]